MITFIYMKRMFFAKLLSIITILLLSSCNKEPFASFVVSNDNPVINEEIKFSNSTKNGFSYEWKYGDGTTSQGFSPKS